MARGTWRIEYLAKRMWEVGKSRGYTSPGFKSGLVFDKIHEAFEL